MTTNTSEVTKEMEHLKATLEQLREDFTALAGSMRDLAADRGHAAFAKAKQVGERARDQASHAQHSLEQEINDRPFASVITSFGIGFALGMLLDRKR
jgi:ElaB/YqjD/DUF883 family membrane-anchored ribosome-binding protein